MAINTTSRKFIDEVHKHSSRWAFWEDPKDIAVGTYGEVDPKTGEFHPRGNIYKEQEILRLMPSLTEPAFSPQPGNQMEDTFTVMSEWMTATTELDTTTFKVKIDSKDEKRGAFVMLSKPQSMFLPLDDIKMREMAECLLLERMFIVTELITCPSFVMGLTKKGQRSVEVGRPATGNWKASEEPDFFREGSDPDNVPKYASLLKLRKISPMWKKWRWNRFLTRDSPPPEPNDAQVWEDAYTPWATLDDEGIEMKVVDEVSDSEEEPEDDDD